MAGGSSTLASLLGSGVCNSDGSLEVSGELAVEINGGPSPVRLWRRMTTAPTAPFLFSVRWIQQRDVVKQQQQWWACGGDGARRKLAHRSERRGTSSAMVLRLHVVTEREDPPKSPVAPHRPAIATLAAESEEGAPSWLSARRLEGSHRLSRPTAASPPGVRRRWRLQPLSLRRMSPEAGERRIAAAGVRHRRWKTGDDGGRSCYVLAGCSSLPPATCFVDVVVVRRRRRITATTDALGVSLSTAH
nr:hypothetical protein Iba_chr13dCG6390 [Ipomoea batatas]